MAEEIYQTEYVWTDGTNKDFAAFYLKTEAYYSKLAGGPENRRDFIPHNLSESITDVLIAYRGDQPIGCAGLKKYSDHDVEIKRVWVDEEYRGRHIATELMKRIERRAVSMGFQRAILQTRPLMKDAVSLYIKLGYRQIENYPPYDHLAGAICFSKELR